MKLIEAQRLDQAFPMTELPAENWMPRIQAFKDICLAMAHAHERGVIHLDLKPQNAMVGKFEKFK